MTKRILFLGGDKRELTVMRALAGQGYVVTASCFPPAMLPDHVIFRQDRIPALKEADACILPVPPLRDGGRLHQLSGSSEVLEDDLFFAARPGIPILMGIVTPYLERAAAHCRLIPMLEEEEVAGPLAEATAEGAVAEVMRLHEGLLFGSRALVVGYGRIGRALAWRLEALGVDVTVTNRGSARAEEARLYGFPVVEWSQLAGACVRSDLIFNTVPSPVLERPQLRWLGRDAVIVDLAAAPGGTDFIACGELGVRAVLAGGLPGKYAPRYAGEVMAEAYSAKLHALLGGEG